MIKRSVQDLDFRLTRPEPSGGLKSVGLVLVRLAGLADDLAVDGLCAPAPTVCGLVKVIFMR
jgi:hypothetical protein